MNDDVRAVIEFWFETPATDVTAFRQKLNRWFESGDSLDREIRERFTDLVERALRGELVEWEAAPRSRLALVILLDQFTRNVFRDSPRAYAGDAMSQRLAEDAIERGWDREMALEERQFLYMPFLHAEDVRLLQRSVECLERQVADAPVELREIFAMGIEQALKYRDVVARFGRYPHRNAALGRVSTEDEIEFLRDWGARQAPRGMKEER